MLEVKDLVCQVFVDIDSGVGVPVGSLAKVLQVLP